LEYITTEQEHDIVVATSNSPIHKTSKEDLLNVVVKWRMYIGIPKNDVAEEIALNAQFLYENYNFLTIQEIELAIKLSVFRKLPDTDFHGYFSPMYIAKVLDSYLHYRKITMADAIRKREKEVMKQMEAANRPSPEQQAKDTRELFRDFYKQWQERGEITDVFTLCYNFLRKHKMMEVPPTMVQEAQAYGKRKVQEVKEKVNKYGSKPSKIQLDFIQEEKKWARNYCVQKFFEKINIDVLCNNIKPEQFT